MSHNFFEKLYQDTHSFEEPRLVDEFPPYISLDQVKGLFSDLKTDRTAGKSNYLRAYANGQEVYGAADRMSNAEVGDADMDTWLSKMLDTDKYGLIINGSLCWSESLTRSVTSLVKDLDKRLLGDFHVSYDLTLFIGNYGYTPFGVHLDDADHRTLLFNIGPHDKKMILWDPAWVREAFGEATNLYEMDEMRAHGDVYNIQPGKGFLLPAKYFHVGLSEEHSITVALVIKKRNPLELVLAELKGMAQSKAARLYDPSFKNPNKCSHSDEELMGVLSDAFGEPEYIYERALKRDASNFHFQRTPHLRSDEVEVHSDTKFKTMGTLFTNSRNIKLEIFARGRLLTLPETEVSYSLVEFINNHQTFEVRELSDAVGFDESILKKLLSSLYSYKAIDVGGN